jgi:hypothetical protein
MNRIHLFEVVDLPWCPAVVRDAATDWIAFMLNGHKGFNTLAPKLLWALSKVKQTNIVDLCSGGGGPWLTLERELAKEADVSVLLTDLFPNRGCMEVLAGSPGKFRLHGSPVDATRVPAELQGVRTIMSGFHHFRPEQARAILQDAVSRRQAIVIFEGSDSRAKGIAMIMLMPLLMWLFMPLVRPFRWSRLALTYAMPVLPMVGLWDGSVSMLRTYSPAELRALIDGVDGHERYEWKVGTEPVKGSPLGLTYLVGVPNEEANLPC